MTTTLEQSFADICEKYDLTALNITFHPAHSQAFSVYSHTGRGEEALCAGESRETIAEALGASLASLSAKRAEIVAFADEALPEAAA